MNQLLGVAYTVNQMSYDLARLRLNGLIERRARTNTYQLTPDGQRVAVFYTKVHHRLLRPLLAADAPPAPIELPGHRPPHQQLHRPRPSRKGRLKTQAKRMSLTTKGVARYTTRMMPHDTILDREPSRDSGRQ